MKLALLLPAVFALSAHGAIVGLHKELKNSPTEAALEYDVVDTFATIEICNFSEQQILDIRALSKFNLVNGQKQDPEFAEYSGELESFTIESELVIPKSFCRIHGKFSCSVAFDLYDTKSYEPRRAEAVCEQL